MTLKLMQKLKWNTFLMYWAYGYFAQNWNTNFFHKTLSRLNVKHPATLILVATGG
jgi:hypothetical protein